MSDPQSRPPAHGTIAPPVAGSRYLESARMAWQATEDKGFWIKALYENPAAGERTWLMKVDPGAFAPRHSHGEFEQFYVLEGSLYDEERLLRAGDYCCRAAGKPHVAGSREGALVLLVYSPAAPETGLPDR